jgi:hypothetical protein
VGRILRLRIAVADRAGALAQAATVMGLHSGNILSIDVHRNDGQNAIDDVVVDFPEDVDLAELGFDLANQAHAEVLSHAATEYHDPIEEVLVRLAELFRQPISDSDDALMQAVADLFPVEVVWVSDEEGLSQIEAAGLALESNDVVAMAGGGAPQLAAAGLDDGACVMAVPLGPRRVLFVARGTPNEFTVTEMARARALAALLAARGTGTRQT